MNPANLPPYDMVFLLGMAVGACITVFGLALYRAWYVVRSDRQHRRHTED